MGLFSRNYNRDRLSVHQLKSYFEMIDGACPTACEDDGSNAILMVYAGPMVIRVEYRRELSCTAISPFNMPYSGPMPSAEIQRIIERELNMPSIRVEVTNIGNAYDLRLNIQMNHRYFSYEELDKNIGLLVDALEKTGLILESNGIL